MKKQEIKTVIRSKINDFHEEIEKLKDDKRSLQSKLSTQAGLSKHSYLYAPTKFVYRDPIYGSIPLCNASFRTLNCQSMQRLRALKQTGPVHLVYTGATHTRLSHSVGTYHLARMVLRHLVSLPGGNDIEPELGRAFLAAALLHDVGHFPHSHILEELKFGKFTPNHEKASIDVINSDSELQEIIQNVWNLELPLVASLIQDSNEGIAIPLFLRTILNSSIDIDKMDYLQRDSYHAGVPYGNIEHMRLIESLRIDSGTGKLLISERGIAPIETVFFAKYLMFRNVYWHHTVRIAAAMLRRCFLDFVSVISDDLKEVTAETAEVRRVLRSTDDTFEQEMTRILNERDIELPASFELLGHLNGRILFKRSATFSCDIQRSLEDQLKDPLRRRDVEMQLCREFSENSNPIEDHDILIDIPSRANFIKTKSAESPDPPDIAFEEPLPGHINGVVPWESRRFVSSFDSAAINELEERIRKIRFVCRPNVDHLNEYVKVKANSLLIG